MMPRLLPRTLVGRVFALYTAVLVGFVVAGLGLFYRYQFTVELENAQLRADTLSSVIVPAVVDSAVIGDYDTIRRTLERAVYHSSLDAATFIDLNGGKVSTGHAPAPEVQPPRWLLDLVAARLYDSNHPINAGGRDYGVLRLSFAADQIAGQLWQQTRIALALALASVIGGLVLMRFPLVHWLGNLGRLQAFEQAMFRGEATPELQGDSVPEEFRKTFEVLGRAAASLQAQRAQASVTLTAIADGVFTFDAAGALAFANPSGCQMLGQPLQALLTRPASALMPALFVAQAGGEASQDAVDRWAGRRVTLPGRDGEPLVLDTSMSPILDADGRVAGHVLACRDISRQHALDERLRQEMAAREAALETLRRVLEGLMQRSPGNGAGPGADDLQAITGMISALVEQLQERGEQLGAIFALSPDGFVSFDAARRANYASPGFARLTGLDAQQVLGAHESRIEALLLERAGGSAPWPGLAALRAPAESGHARQQLELAWPVRRVLELGLREGSSATVSQVLSLRDVTHETEVDQMKSEFLSTAAHELRTPMTSIFGYAELMMKRPLRPEQQQEVMATIHRQTARMIAIVNELLDLARIEARRGKDFELQTLDLAALAAEVMHDFKPPQERGRPLWEADGRPLPVRVDRGKLGQAFGNVLSNAYKYSPQGGAVTVSLLCEPQRGVPMAGLRVKDRGVGMTPAQLARVGERFYRADTSGNIPGTGLGMSIVKEIVGLLGGEVELDSAPGEGSTVTVWLPLATAHADALIGETA